MPSGGLPREGHKSDRPLGPLFSPPRVGQDSGPGGEESPTPVMPTL